VRAGGPTLAAPTANTSHSRTRSSNLAGDLHAGLYPLMRGDACRLLACDFDGPGWMLDALAFRDATHAAGIPSALERSRSGDDGHVWIFFGESVPASPRVDRAARARGRRRAWQGLR
jgi:hypothetical protein